MIFVNLPNLKQYLVSKGGTLLARMAHVKALNDRIDINNKKEYKAAISQSSTTNIKEDYIINNTLGKLTFKRTGVGTYILNSDSLFTKNKTAFSVYHSIDNSDNLTKVSITYVSIKELSIKTFRITEADAGGELVKTLSDDVLSGGAGTTMLTIEVYP